MKYQIGDQVFAYHCESETLCNAVVQRTHPDGTVDVHIGYGAEPVVECGVHILSKDVALTADRVHPDWHFTDPTDPLPFEEVKEARTALVASTTITKVEGGEPAPVEGEAEGGDGEIEIKPIVE